MNKESKRTIKYISLGIIVFVFIFLSLIFFSEKYDESCLDKKGEDFCLESNYTQYKNRLEYYGHDFACHNGESERTLEYSNYERFYFLEEEFDFCVSKPKKSFKKLDANGGIDG